MMESFNSAEPPKLYYGNLYLSIFAFSLYFNKDAINGRCIGKRAFNFQVIDIKTNAPASSLKCLIRNITVILWPIEVIVSMINTSRRLGDLIAGTRLSSYEPTTEKHSLDWKMIIVSLLLGMIITYLIAFYPIEYISRFNEVGTVSA